MIIKYEWKCEDRRHNEYTVEYEFSHYIQDEDFAEYLLPLRLQPYYKPNLTNEEVVEKKHAMIYIKKTLQYLYEQGMDLEEILEDDEFFIEFIKDKYNDKAYMEYCEDNDDL